MLTRRNLEPFQGQFHGDDLRQSSISIGAKSNRRNGTAQAKFTSRRGGHPLYRMPVSPSFSAEEPPTSTTVIKPESGMLAQVCRTPSPQRFSPVPSFPRLARRSGHDRFGIKRERFPLDPSLKASPACQARHSESGSGIETLVLAPLTAAILAILYSRSPLIASALKPAKGYERCSTAG